MGKAQAMSRGVSLHVLSPLKHTARFGAKEMSIIFYSHRKIENGKE